MHADNELRRRFEEIVWGDRDLAHLLTAARELALPQRRVVSGCLYQTVWNVLTKKPARTGIKDYDLIYFDDSDLSWEAEDQVVSRVGTCIRDLPAPVEVRNQARVHLWFKQRFVADYPPLRSADESLTRYASIVHAVGVRLDADGQLDIVAPFGLDDLFGMIIRPNRVIDNQVTHEAKAARAKAIWSEVVVVPWSTRHCDDKHPRAHRATPSVLNWVKERRAWTDRFRRTSAVRGICRRGKSANYGTRRQQSTRRQVVFGHAGRAGVLAPPSPVHQSPD